MNTMRYWLLLLLVSCASAPITSGPKKEFFPDPELYDRLVVVGTNDFHGYLKPVETDLQGNKVILGGAEWFAGYVRILEEKFGDQLILLDGGDLFQGTMESNLFLGKPVVDYYNLLPYRAAVVGNHEFDYGPRKKNDPDRLGAFKDRMAEANFPFVQANIFWKKSKKLWKEKNLYPSVMIQAGKYKVGVIGLTTISTPAKTLPKNVEKLEFRDFLEPTLNEIKQLRSKGADFILITTHEGGEKPGEPLYELLGKLPSGSVDAVVSGHAHAEVNEMVFNVPVIQSKARGLHFGRIDLFVKKEDRKIDTTLTKIYPMHWICGTWFQNQESCDSKGAKDLLASGKDKIRDLFPLRSPVYEGKVVQPDLSVRAILEPYFAQTEEKKKEKLGVAQVDFEYLPSGENQMGFLFLEAFQDAFPYAKVIFHNGGGIRRKFFKGDITYGDLYEVHPFDNFAVAVKMKGKQLKDLVRLGVSGANSIPAVRGVKVTYFGDEDQKYLRDVNNDGKKENWERNRLDSLLWEKTLEPVKDEEEFWLATNDYLASGGDNTAHVFGSIPETQRKYLDLTQRDVVAEYLRRNPNLPLPRKEEMRILRVK
jgi:5'-nucleotidase